jgi:hypothetical protein
MWRIARGTELPSDGLKMGRKRAGIGDTGVLEAAKPVEKIFAARADKIWRKARRTKN